MYLNQEPRMFKLTAPKVISRSAALSYLAVLLLFFLSASLPAAPVSAQLARLFAQQWLASADKPLKADFSAHSISEVSAIENADGLLIGYHVALLPEGYVLFLRTTAYSPWSALAPRALMMTVTPIRCAACFWPTRGRSGGSRRATRGHPPAASVPGRPVRRTRAPGSVSPIPPGRARPTWSPNSGWTALLKAAGDKAAASTIITPPLFTTITIPLTSRATLTI